MVILSKHNNTLSGIAQTSLQTLSIAKNILRYAVSIMVLLVLSLSSRADTVITDMPICRQPVAIVPSDSTSIMAARAALQSCGWTLSRMQESPAEQSRGAMPA